jgi:hypothetical protein
VRISSRVESSNSGPGRPIIKRAPLGMVGIGLSPVLVLIPGRVGNPGLAEALGP